MYFSNCNHGTYPKKLLLWELPAFFKQYADIHGDRKWATKIQKMCICKIKERLSNLLLKINMCLYLISRPSQPITNALVDPCCGGIEPLKFPNLVTGFDKAPHHAAKTALYTRYTPHEWGQYTVANYNESDTKRNYAERLRNDIVRCVR